MHSFKKVAAGVALFLAFTVCATCFVAAPAFMPDSLYNDSETRAALAGTIDTIFCGQSQALIAFDPMTVDSSIGTSSYNLSSYACTFDGRETMLKKELARNPVKTVVLEIAFDCLLESSADNSTGEAMIVCKLDTPGEKLAYFIDHASLNNAELDNIYAMFMRYGLNAWKAKLSGNVNIPQSNRGRIPQSGNDVTISPERIAAEYNSKTFDSNFSDKIFSKLGDIVEMCRAQGTEVIIAVTPLSDALLWQYNNLERVHEAVSAFAADKNCPYVDFNLYKKRGELFSDDVSFFDEAHMCDAGAEVFSREFAGILEMIKQGESIDELFCASYDEVKQSLPYAAALAK